MEFRNDVKLIQEFTKKLKKKSLLAKIWGGTFRAENPKLNIFYCIFVEVKEIIFGHFKKFLSFFQQSMAVTLFHKQTKQKSTKK